LSNEESKVLLQEIQHNDLAHIILSHISETNNTPEKAMRAVGQAITCCGARLDAASQHEAGNLIRIPER
jgi:phosphoribosyl 1,2-cyclic phosphodiesterase